MGFSPLDFLCVLFKSSTSLPDDVVACPTHGSPAAGSKALCPLGYAPGHRGEGGSRGEGCGTGDRSRGRVGNEGRRRGCGLGKRLQFDAGAGGLARVKLLGKVVVGHPWRAAGGRSGSRGCWSNINGDLDRDMGRCWHRSWGRNRSRSWRKELRESEVRPLKIAVDYSAPHREIQNLFTEEKDISYKI